MASDQEPSFTVSYEIERTTQGAANEPNSTATTSAYAIVSMVQGATSIKKRIKLESCDSSVLARTIVHRKMTTWLIEMKTSLEHKKIAPGSVKLSGDFDHLAFEVKYQSKNELFGDFSISGFGAHDIGTAESIAWKELTHLVDVAMQRFDPKGT